MISARLTHPILVLGGGGHAKVVISTLQLQNARILGILDSNPALAGKSVLGVPVLGGDDKISDFQPGSILLANGLGSVSTPLTRRKLFDRYSKLGYGFANVVHPQAIVSPDAVAAEGVQILAGAVIQPGVWLGANSIINTRASVDHDCRIGAHVHLAPGVTLSGEVQIGETTHIGTGATIIQGIRVGSECMIAAGAVVISDIPERSRALGVPAQVRGPRD